MIFSGAKVSVAEIAGDTVTTTQSAHESSVNIDALADDFRELVLVLAKVGLEIHVNATILENLDGGGGEGIRNEYAGFCHRSYPQDRFILKRDGP